MLTRKIQDVENSERLAKKALFDLLQKVNVLVDTPGIKGVSSVESRKLKNDVEQSIASLRGVFTTLKAITMNNELS